jgi:RNA polymerase sigma factor (sigma-70 family)
MQPISKLVTYDPASNRLLYEEYYGKLLKVAFRYVGTYEQAQEVTHNGFLTLFRELSRLGNDQSAILNAGLSVWISRTFIISVVEQMKSKPTLQISGLIPEHLWKKNDQVYSGAEIMSIELIKILKGLAAHHRIIFNLYVIDGFSHEEIAKIMGITVRHSEYSLIKARRYCDRALGLLFQSVPAP